MQFQKNIWDITGQAYGLHLAVTTRSVTYHEPVLLEAPRLQRPTD